MPDTQQASAASKPPAPLSSLLFIAATLAVVAIGCWLESPRAQAAFAQARVFFTDPDDYLRTHRGRQIAAGQAVRIRNMPEINAPIGAELHWTAPMDYLLAGAAVGLGGLVDHADPTAYAAAWVPACLGAIYVVCMMRFMRRGFGLGPAVLTGLVVVFSPAFHRVFQVGHPDHHCLLELLLLIALGGWIPRRRPDGSPGAPTTAGAAISGLATGLAIWIAAQAVFFWLAMIVGLTYACLFGPPPERLRYHRARLAWNCAVALAVLAGFLVENWPGLSAAGIDKISTVHLALVAIGFLSPIRVGAPHRRAKAPAEEARPAKDETPAHLQTQTTRNIALLAAMAAFTIWMAVDRSRTFEHVSRSEFYRWSERIAELQPLYTRTPTDWSVQPIHARLGFLPYALPVLMLFFLLSDRVPRPLKGTLGLLAPVVVVLTIMQRRWLDHANLAVTPVVVIGAWELFRTVLGKETWRRANLSVIPAAAVLAILVYPSAKIVASMTTEDAILANRYQERSDFVAQHIAAYEALSPPPDSGRRAILCEDGEGPMLLYCTGLPVVATPYHRALGGLVEAARFYAQRDPQEARRQLDRLGVRYVVMPPRAHEQLMDFEKIAFGEFRSFDPPTETINRFGGIIRKLNYRPQEIALTMVYRLVREPEGKVIPGVERIAEIKEGATGPDGRPMDTGLLYVVHDLPTTTGPAPASAPEQ